MNEEIQDELVDVFDTGIALDMGRTKIYQLFNSGELKAVKKSRRTYIWRSEINRYLRSLPAYPVKGKKDV